MYKSTPSFNFSLSIESQCNFQKLILFYSLCPFEYKKKNTNEFTLSQFPTFLCFKNSHHLKPNTLLSKSLIMHYTRYLCFVICKVKATHTMIFAGENARLSLAKVILML